MTLQQSINFEKELPKPVYFNTTGLKNPELKEKQKKVVGQSAEILHIFANNPQVAFTPWQIYDKLQGCFPITSVRARITTLERMAYLIQTEERRIDGPYKSTCLTWKLNPNQL